MELDIIHNKEEIFKFLARDPELQIFLIGDLDEFFWPKTIWYAARDNNEIKAIALLYVGMIPSTLLTFSNEDDRQAMELIKMIKPFLPEKLMVHLSPWLLDVFGKENILENYGRHNKMTLKKSPEDINDKNIRKLTTDNLSEIKELYSIAYPYNWFDTRMLETGKYFGYFHNERLIGIAGIHVYSEEYKVAALGNITTHPDYRGQQIAYKLTTVLCNDLKQKVDIIGLNVKSDNTAAIKCYEKIGFKVISSFDVCLLKNNYHA
jgi:ribosomal protein S18 acetylase RimI-like enzyme